MKLLRVGGAALLVVLVACRDSTRPVDPASVASVSLTPSAVGVVKGLKQSLKLTAKDTSGSEVRVNASWSSSAPSVATVTGDGVVSAVSYGTATITATVGTRTAYAAIVVTSIPTTNAYTITDLGPAASAGSYGRHLSDSGDVLLGWSAPALYRHGATTPLAGCTYGLTINGPGHVLCRHDLNDSISSYGIWRGGLLTPLAATDTFKAQHFRAFALSDSDEVPGLFFMPLFTNARCPANGARCLSVWKGGVPSFPGYDAGGSDAMLMNDRQQVVVEYAMWSENVYGSVIYDVATATSRQTQYGIRAFNDNGWGAITSPWIAHGSADPFRSTAYALTPTALILLGDGGATGINNANAVVGTLTVGPFIWRGQGVSLLTNAVNDVSWTITAAVEINNRGQILATADNADGRKAHTVLLTPAQP